MQYIRTISVNIVNIKLEESMEANDKKRICRVGHAGALDSGLRRLLQNPKRILKPYLGGGMAALDLGCGPGYFTFEIARLVGPGGKVTAADLQDGMLEIMKNKIHSAGFSNIKLHKCGEDKTGLSEKFDFILVFYMLHEVPDQPAFLQEIKSLLKEGGHALVAEPDFRVSKEGFQKSVSLMEKAGLRIVKRPSIFLSRAVVVKNAV